MSLWQKLVITILTMLVAGFVAGLIWGNIFDVTMPSYLAGMAGGLAAILIWELLKKVVIRESMLSKWSLSFMLITIIALYFIVGVQPDALADSGSIDPRINNLYEHLGQTKSIGIFTKLSIKNNTARLNKSFAAHHQGKRPPNIKELRERYDLMVQEMMILVQGKDPELAREIYEVRLLLWSYLSDPEKYKLI
ncbi:MAG TPA: hypothetical protein EYQ42_11605 [Thiotrichaceae bacterium]|jgi:hypothetical protein|nr:hypothetical protein [Thiotrichaceae bacterium]HIM08201.1 hypothetical protein [Gammaproteobacteria bacterium]